MTLSLVLLALIALLWLWLLVNPHGGVRRLPNSTTACPGSDDQLPPVVVILAAQNEATMLPRTIATICRQEYPELRVILVDDQSDDGSPAVVQKL